MFLGMKAIYRAEWNTMEAWIVEMAVERKKKPANRRFGPHQKRTRYNP